MGPHQKGLKCRNKRCSQNAINSNDLFGAPERIRTSDPQIRSLVLYPAELRARAGRAGDHRFRTDRSAPAWIV